jgi:hypothetical protein
MSVAHTILRVSSRFLLIPTAIVSCFVTAEAARLTVRVSNSSNAPVAGASACFNNFDGSVSQSRTTNAQGEAVLDNVPQGEMKIVISRNGFVGAERLITMGASDRIEAFVLQSGSGGPVCGSSSPTAPAVLRVQVLRQNATVLPEAIVCIAQGSNGNAKLTDSQGRAVFEGPAPTLPFTFRLVVVKGDFQTVDRQETMTSATQQLSVILLQGTSTLPSNITCPLLGSVAGQTILPSINITNLKVNGGSLQTTTDRTVTLTATFSRTPGVYRVGEIRDLTNRPWIPFSPTAPITYQLNLADERGVNFGVRQIHFQVAPTASNSSLSNIAITPVILAPEQISIRTITGAELQQFLSRALDAGYNFASAGLNRQLFEGSNSIPFTSRDCTRTPEAPETALKPDAFGRFRYVQKDTIRIFDGPPLNAFWKILDVGVTPKTDQLLASSVVESVSAASSQGLQQIPARTVAIRSEMNVAPIRIGVFPIGSGETSSCISSSANFRITLIPPTITSLTISGPSNLELRKGLPPRN